MRIAVTGVTGGLGSRVARQLAAGGGDHAAELGGARVERAAHGDGSSVRRALAGADAVLMVSGAEDEHRVDQHRTFVDAAAAAGVGHVVCTSFLRASPRSTSTLGRDHAATEDHLRASGLAHTVLRDALYADSLPLLAGDEASSAAPPARAGWRP